jgi:hypothetical protein
MPEDDDFLCSVCFAKGIPMSVYDVADTRAFVQNLSLAMLTSSSSTTFAEHFAECFSLSFLLLPELLHYMNSVASLSVKKQIVACLFERAYPQEVSPRTPSNHNIAAFADMMGMLVTSNSNDPCEILGFFFRAMADDRAAVHAICSKLSGSAHEYLCKKIIQLKR